MSKEVLQATLVKKRECNRRAQVIVERLLEETVPEEWFLGSLQYISESHFQDVVEERAIAKLCGYPLCRGQLPPAPAQQFRISTRLNKVYDITDRKNFCSNRCYAAAKFLKQQLQTSPLWLRDKEEAPVFTLLPTAGPSEGVGDELDFSVEKVVTDKSEPPCESTPGCEQEERAGDTEQVENRGSELADRLAAGEATCGELGTLPCDSGTESKTPGVSSVLNTYVEVNYADSAVLNTGKGSSDEHEVQTVMRVSSDSNCLVAEEETGCSLEPGGVGYKEEKSERDGSVCTVDIESVGSKSTDKLDNVNSDHLSSICVSSVTNSLEASGKQVEVRKKSSGGKKGRSRRGNEESGLRGWVVYVEKCVKEWFTADTLKLLLGEESRDSLGDNGVPLVDHHAQAALRRRIVLDRLSRVVPDLLAALGVVGCDVSSDVRELVTSFSLGAHNITFHVPEWNLLGLILINIVGLKNDGLQRQLRSKKVKNAQSMILLSFQQDSGYLDRLMCWLLDVDHETR